MIRPPVHPETLHTGQRHLGQHGQPVTAEVPALVGSVKQLLDDRDGESTGIAHATLGETSAHMAELGVVELRGKTGSRSATTEQRHGLQTNAR